MKRFRGLPSPDVPSPAMVVACLALFVALSGVSYAVATIGSNDIVNGSIRNVDFKNGTLRGNEAKPNGFGAGAIKEESLDPTKIRPVPIAGVGGGLARQAVVGAAGNAVRGRGVTSAARSGPGEYVIVFDADVRNCAYFGTIGDVSAAGPGNGQISVAALAANVNAVRVVTRNSAGELTNNSFHLIVSC